MIPVDSSDLSEVGYDSETGSLVVEFKRGNVYRYEGVSQEIYNGLIGSDSVGKYFNQYIKGSYSYSKI